MEQNILDLKMVVNGWAFNPNCGELQRHNRTYYRQLIDKIGGPDAVRIERKNMFARYEFTLHPLTEEAKNITPLEACLIADHGSLVFGCRSFGKNSNGTFYGIVHTD